MFVDAALKNVKLPNESSADCLSCQEVPVEFSIILFPKVSPLSSLALKNAFLSPASLIIHTPKNVLVDSVHLLVSLCIEAQIF